MRLKFTLTAVPIAVYLATLAPHAVKAQAPAASQEFIQPSPAAPQDPHGSRPVDSRSESPYLQLPRSLRHLEPMMPPPPREGAAGGWCGCLGRGHAG